MGSFWWIARVRSWRAFMVVPFNLTVITFPPSAPWKQQDFNFTSETSALHCVCFDQADKKSMHAGDHTHTEQPTRAEMNGWAGQSAWIQDGRLCACMFNVCVSVYMHMLLLYLVYEYVCVCACASILVLWPQCTSLCIETTALQCCRLDNQQPSNEQEQCLSRTTYQAPLGAQDTPISKLRSCNSHRSQVQQWRPQILILACLSLKFSKKKKKKLATL